MGFLIMNKKVYGNDDGGNSGHVEESTANEMMLNEGNKKQFWFWNI